MAKSLAILATVAENCAMLTLKSTSHTVRNTETDFCVIKSLYEYVKQIHACLSLTVLNLLASYSYYR